MSDQAAETLAQFLERRERVLAMQVDAIRGKIDRKLAELSEIEAACKAIKMKSS